MNEIGQVLAEIADREFDGTAYNGPSFMATLRALPLDQVLSTETLEGFSVFAIALHVLYYKHFVLTFLGADVEPFPYEKTGWPAVPAEADQESWTEVLDRMKHYHALLGKAIREISPSALEEVVPAWRITKRDALLWYVTHDVYHVAQIRNMGVPGLEFKPPE